jgi:hypothetical protein
VCLLPGTEIAFEKEVEYEHHLGFLTKWARGKKIKQKVAQFEHLNKDKTNMHHDALEFPDGQAVLVTTLRQGQYATVLQLPAAPRRMSEAEKQNSTRSDVRRLQTI